MPGLYGPPPPPPPPPPPLHPHHHHGGGFPGFFPYIAEPPVVYAVPYQTPFDVGSLLSNSRSLAFILVPAAVGYFVSSDDKKATGTLIGLAAGVALALFSLSQRSTT